MINHEKWHEEKLNKHRKKSILKRNAFLFCFLVRIYNCICTLFIRGRLFVHRMQLITIVFSHLSVERNVIYHQSSHSLRFVALWIFVSFVDKEKIILKKLVLWMDVELIVLFKVVRESICIISPLWQYDLY